MTEEGKSLPWKFDYLPVIPRKFELEPIKQSEDRLKRFFSLPGARTSRKSSTHAMPGVKGN